MAVRHHRSGAVGAHDREGRARQLAGHLRCLGTRRTIGGRMMLRCGESVRGVRYRTPVL